jgi:hypothetical protein
MNWSEQQLADHLAKTGVAGRDRLPDVGAPPFQPPAVAGRDALGRLPRGTMNKTEAAYAAHLELLKHAGEIVWWKFEPMKFRLADATFFTPDFVVLMNDGFLDVKEVKGFMEDDANVKIKVAASLYPFRFYVVRKKQGGGWSEESFSR